MGHCIAIKSTVVSNKRIFVSDLEIKKETKWPLYCKE